MLVVRTVNHGVAGREAESYEDAAEIRSKLNSLGRRHQENVPLDLFKLCVVANESRGRVHLDRLGNFLAHLVVAPVIEVVVGDP